MAIVEFINISKHFGAKDLLKSVNFKLHKGQITTLIGQNGAGKTTIAKLMLGLEKPSDGEVKLDRSVKIGYIPQKVNSSHYMPITSESLINMLAPDASYEDLNIFSDFLNLTTIAKLDISKLSGGQLQKLILVATIINKPHLLILDEPTQYFDVSSQQEFYRLLKKVRDQINMTIFMISHDLFTVMKNSDQVICLNGHVCCSGKPSELNDNNELKLALSEIGVYLHKHDHEHEH